MRRVLLALLLALVAGCGVPTDPAPRDLDPEGAPFRFYEQPAEPEGPGQVGLYFVRGDPGQVVLLRRAVEGSTSIEELAELLLDGPTPDEIEDGTGTALPPDLSVEDVELTERCIAVVTLGGGTQIGTSPLAFAQIVTTLTAAGRARAVRFRLDGDDVAALRGDGSPTNDPVTRADYAGLLAVKPSPESTPSPASC